MYFDEATSDSYVKIDKARLLVMCVALEERILAKRLSREKRYIERKVQESNSRSGLVGFFMNLFGARLVTYDEVLKSCEAKLVGGSFGEMIGELYFIRRLGQDFLDTASKLRRAANATYDDYVLVSTTHLEDISLPD